MTFGEMKTQVKNWLGVGNLDTQIPTFINMAMRRVEREYNWKEMEQYWYDPETGYQSLSTDYIKLPDNFKAIKFVRVWWSGGGSYSVPILDFDTLQAKWPLDNWSDHAAPGAPKDACGISYADWSLVFKPYPDNLSNYYNVDLVYYVYTPDLSADADTNHWTTYGWEVLLFGALIEAAPYMIETENPRLPIWQMKYAEALARLRKVDTERDMGRGSIASTSTIIA